jgi:hypothetical protein
MRLIATILMGILALQHQAGAQKIDRAGIPDVKTTASPSATSGDYVTDLRLAIRQAVAQKKKVILYTGHNFHLAKRGLASPRAYFDGALTKASQILAKRRSDFIVCELFEFTPMHDTRGNFTPDYVLFIKGWFGRLNDRYDIRFITPTLTILDSSGSKLDGPFDNFAGFGETLDAALRKMP